MLVPLCLHAERPLVESPARLSLDNRVGYNAAMGVFGASGLTAEYNLPQYFMVRGGVQYNSIDRFAAEVRPAYFHDFSFGRLHGELLLHYNLQSGINNICAGAGVGLTMRHLWVNVGYYYRAMTSGGQSLTEPFNIYYELGVNCLPNIERWDLLVAVTNASLYDLERVYQPTLQLDAVWYPTTSMGVKWGIAYKFAGMFNLSNDYYQTYIHFGISYRW